MCVLLFPPKSRCLQNQGCSTDYYSFLPWACHISNLKFRYDGWHLFVLCCIYFFPLSLEARCADSFVNQGREVHEKIQKEAFLSNTFMYYSVPPVSVVVDIKREDTPDTLTQFLVTKYWQTETDFWLSHFVASVWNNFTIIFHIYLYRLNATAWNLAVDPQRHLDSISQIWISDFY